jgi:hypothetical protein
MGRNTRREFLAGAGAAVVGVAAMSTGPTASAAESPDAGGPAAQTGPAQGPRTLPQAVPPEYSVRLDSKGLTFPAESRPSS